MNLIPWIGMFAALTALAYVATRMTRPREIENTHDTGQAILDFGRAFPQEAIRSLHYTQNGQAIFVRLFDGKAGFMRNMGKHFSCIIIEPGTVQVRSIAGAKGFAIDFQAHPAHNGEYIFGNPSQAAEVSLWLLGNYVKPADRTADFNGAALS